MASHVLRAAVLVGVLGAAGATLAGPPDTDAERLARIERMVRTYRIAYLRVDSIDATELERRLRAGDPLVLVDVRPAPERAVSTLPGSITLEQLRGDREAYRTREIVTFCTVGARSGVAARKLVSEGWDVLNFEGSLLAWTHIGGELVDDEGNPTRRVHVYGKRWNLVAEGYQAVLTGPNGEEIEL